MHNLKGCTDPLGLGPLSEELPKIWRQVGLIGCKAPQALCIQGVAMIRGSGSARSTLARSPSCPSQNPTLNIPRSSKPERASFMCKPATFHANGDTVQNRGYFPARPYHPRQNRNMKPGYRRKAKAVLPAAGAQRRTGGWMPS